jgi:hypothetical protein
MPGQPIDEAIADLLKSLNKGQYIILCEAIRQAGGRIEVEASWFARAVASPNPQLNIDSSDGPIVLRLM